MQPAAASDRSGMIIKNKGARTGEGGYVNSEQFWRKKVEDVPVDQVSFCPRLCPEPVLTLVQLFFHKFFSTKLANKAASAKKGKKQGDSDDEDMAEESAEEDEEEVASAAAEDEGSASDPEEDEIWKVCDVICPWGTQLTRVRP